MDGRIMGENLTRMNLDEKWLKRQLKKQGYNGEKQIFLGIYHPDENKLTLYPNE